jgi:restriction system protein
VTSIEPPNDGRLPPGPHRDLVLALHELYQGAGRPGLRRIASAIRRTNEYPDTVSHETVSAILRAEGVPRWPKLESLVRQLIAWHHPRLEADEQVSRFLELWNAVSSPDSSSQHDRGSQKDRAATDPSASPQSPRYPVPARAETVPPGRVPAIWGNITHRNRNFTGRSDVLEQVRDRIAAATGGGGTSLALYGLPGAGKTQVALEYVHRYRSDYDLVWWIPSEQTSLVRSSLAALAGQLSIGPAMSAGIDGTIAAVLDALRRGTPHPRWLLVFDNADQPEEILHYVPDGSGHVLITSRNPRWRGVVDAVTVGVFSRAESVAFLSTRTHEVIAGGDADMLAEKLGDLPLALAQAAQMADKGMSPAQYALLLSQRPGFLLDEGKPPDYPASMSQAFSTAVKHIGQQLPVAVEFLRCLALLGPEPIPLEVFRQDTHATQMARADRSELSRILADPILLGAAIDSIGRFGLVSIDAARDSVQVHRLIQALIRDDLTEDDEAKLRGQATHLFTPPIPPATGRRTAAGDQTASPKQLAAQQNTRQHMQARRHEPQRTGEDWPLAVERRMAEAGFRTDAARKKVAALEQLLQARNRSLAKQRRRAQEIFNSQGPEAFVEVLQQSLARSVYPYGMRGSCAAMYQPEARKLLIEYELPSQDVVPAAEAYHYVKTMGLVQPKPRGKAEIRSLYVKLIASVTLRTLAEAFDASPKDLVGEIIFNGYVSSGDPAATQPVKPLLISARATRENFAEVVLDEPELDPIACLHGYLNATVSPNPYDLETIRPVAQFDLSKLKFVEEMDIVAGLGSRPDLLVLKPVEFEHLIRQLLEALGIKSWITQASRTHGVDAVAVSEDPIMGGLCVFQAKRYTKVVGLEAVRALASAIEDNHAAKGILITTSWVSAAGRHFATQHGGIEIIEGSQLKQMLLEHLGINALINLPKPQPD